MQRISTRLDALDRLGDFESRVNYAEWRRKRDAMDRIWVAFHVAFPTSPMERRLSESGTSYLVEPAPPGSPTFEAGLQAFCERVDGNTMTDSDRALIAALADDFVVMGFGAEVYVRALARVLTDF